MMTSRPALGPPHRYPGRSHSMDDAAFKKLFSDPRMIRLLIRKHVPEWAYRVVGRMPGDARPTDPQDLPQVVLGLSGVRTAAQMRAALTVLRQLVEACEDSDFDRFMARSVKAMLRSKGFSNRQLEEAMTMSTVVTEFQRSLDEIKQEGIEQGQVAVLVQQIARKFGEGTAEEVQRSILGSPGRERIAWVAAAILDCDTPEDFLARVRVGIEGRFRTLL